MGWVYNGLGEQLERGTDRRAGVLLNLKIFAFDNAHMDEGVFKYISQHFS